jgi:hypothetical protein
MLLQIRSFHPPFEQLPQIQTLKEPQTVRSLFTNSIFDSSPATNFSYVSIAKSSLSFSFFLVAACICNVLIFMYDGVCILRRTSLSCSKSYFHLPVGEQGATRNFTWLMEGAISGNVMYKFAET